jgi:hypothetical protein
MNHTIASKEDIKAKASIRWSALVLALGLWLMGIGFGLRRSGKTFQQANADATAGVVLGLIAWTVYHTVSRQNNGLIIIITVAGQPVLMTPPDRTLGLFELGTLLAFQVTVAGFFGLMSRWYHSKARKGDPSPTDAMYDAEMDAHSAGRVL